MSVDTDHSQMWNDHILNHTVLFLAVPGMWQLHLTSFIPLEWPRKLQLYCTCVYECIYTHTYLICVMCIIRTPLGVRKRTVCGHPDVVINKLRINVPHGGFINYKLIQSTITLFEMYFIQLVTLRTMLSLSHDTVTGSESKSLRVKEKLDANNSCCESAQQKVRPLDELRLRALGRDTELWWWIYTTCDYSLNVLWHWFRK